MITSGSLAYESVIHIAEDSPGKSRYHLHGPALDKGVLLIASKQLRDPNFEKTVILITAFDNYGTTGLVINRRTRIPASEALPQMQDLLPELDHLYIGGPVAIRSINLLIRSDSIFADTTQITEGIHLVNTLKQFNELDITGLLPENLRLFAGVSGWAPGQLESELIRGDWYLWYSDQETVFSPEPALLWERLISTVSARWTKTEIPGSAHSVKNMENMLKSAPACRICEYLRLTYVNSINFP